MLLRDFAFRLGGERGIRTPGTLRYNSFQDCRIRPLCHFSAAKVVIDFKYEIIFSLFTQDFIKLPNTQKVKYQNTLINRLSNMCFYIEDKL